MARKKRGGFGRRGKRLADMSLPPEERHRKRASAVGGTPPAQLGHATGGKARKKRREGEKKMDRSR
jgi:hypothetical protein